MRICALPVVNAWNYVLKRFCLSMTKQANAVFLTNPDAISAAAVSVFVR